MKNPSSRCPHCTAFFDFQSLHMSNVFTHTVFECGRCGREVAYDLDFGLRLPTVCESRAALFTHRLVRPRSEMIEQDFLKHGQGDCRPLAGRNYRLLGSVPL
jgi:hypothetical protein